MGLIARLLGKRQHARPSLAEGAREVNLQQSPPHLDLLCYFTTHRAAEQRLSEDWQEALGEAVGTAVQRLVSAGLLMPLTVEETLAREFTAAELRAQLLQHRLPVSGTKAVQIQRLLKADRDAAHALVASLGCYECTGAGAALVQARRVALDVLRDEAVERSRRHVASGDYASAAQEVARLNASFKVQRAPQSPLAIEDRREVGAVVASIATARPRILGELSAQQWEALRVASAMDYFWGGGLQSWLPLEVSEVGRLSVAAAGRMLVSAARERGQLERMRGSGIRYASIVCLRDSCPACQAIAGRTRPLDELPELPHAECTNWERGCLCFRRPVLPR